MEDVKQNKMQTPPLNNKKLKVKINRNRAIAGVGKAGDVVEMTEADARRYEREGFVTILKEI